jgi:hypothetical protein
MPKDFGTAVANREYDPLQNTVHCTLFKNLFGNLHIKLDISGVATDPVEDPIEIRVSIGSLKKLPCPDFLEYVNAINTAEIQVVLTFKLISKLFRTKSAKKLSSKKLEYNILRQGSGQIRTFS